VEYKKVDLIEAESRMVVTSEGKEEGRRGRSVGTVG
jgi:hypothetical protein